ncbi:MAG: class GN sortase [Burkholderiales bacterium]
MPEPLPAVTARHVAADLLGFIARAVAIAVVCAVGLAAATLLLALPARADEPGTGMRWLAQDLIARAWERTLAGEREVRPWPWADTWPVAKLLAPTLGIEQYVLAGDAGSALAVGPGHPDGTPLPGSPGNSVIGGHRDTQLAFLRRLRPGDPIMIERADGVRIAFRVFEADVLDQGDVWVTKQEGPTRLTLVTCYPFDALCAGGRQRYVVFAFERLNRGGKRGTRG